MGTTREVLVLRSSIVCFVSLCSNCASHVCYMAWYPLFIQGRSRARSYHAESTRSLLHTEVKRHRARLVVRGGSPCCAPLFVCFLFHFAPTAQVNDLVTLVHPRAQSVSYHAESTRSLLHTEVKRHRRVSSGGGPRAKSSCCAPQLFFFVSLCSNCASHVCLHGLVSLVHPRAQSSAIISCRIHRSLLHTEVKRHRAG